MKYSVYAFLLMTSIALVVFLINIFFSKTNSAKNFTLQPEQQVKQVIVNSEGRRLFQNNCAQCHSLYKDLTGPALNGVENRGPWTDRKKLIRWVKNPAATINEFEYTKNLFKQYGGTMMTSFPHLTDKEIEAIFDYIKKSPTAVPMPIASR